MEVRIATENDIEALCPILTEFFAYNAQLQPLYCNAAVENGDYPKEVIENDMSDFLIAVDGGSLVGFIHINQTKTLPYDAIVPHNYAEITAFMVTEKCRGKGIGSKLIEYAKQWSKDRNLDHIELLSLVNANEANKFYDKNDFLTMSYLRKYEL